MQHSHVISLSIVTILIIASAVSRATCANTSRELYPDRHQEPGERRNLDQQQQQQQQKSQFASLTSAHESDEVLRQLLKAALFVQDKQIQQQQQLNDGADNSLGELIKRKPSAEESGGELPPARQPANVNEHVRNILDDKFGIRRDSVFTTNNHLGLKGVPKFGSEEQF